MPSVIKLSVVMLNVVAQSEACVPSTLKSVSDAAAQLKNFFYENFKIILKNEVITNYSTKKSKCRIHNTISFFVT